jgi:hypothetical protein
MMRRVLIGLGIGVVLLSALAVGGWFWAIRSVETPAYAVAEADGRFEIRDYPAMVVAEVAVDGPRREALSAGFRPLARYIFAREREGGRIAMTAPVTQTDGGDGWIVGFVMPAEYDLADLPPPGPTPVTLRETPPARMAAVRFSGRADDALLAEREEALRGWMAARGLAAAGAPVHAHYDDPLTPGFLRRNEILIPVGPPSG